MLVSSTEQIRQLFKSRTTPRSYDLELARASSRPEVEICPITLGRLDELSPHGIYTDLNDGIRYDREALRQWFQQSIIMPHCNEERPEDRRIVLLVQPQSGGRPQTVMTRPPRLSNPLRVPNAQVLGAAVNLSGIGFSISWPMFIAAGVHWGRFRHNAIAKNVTLGSGCAVGASVELLAVCVKMLTPDGQKTVRDSFGFVGITHASLGLLAMLPTALGSISNDQAAWSILIAEAVTFATGSLMIINAACSFRDVLDR